MTFLGRDIVDYLVSGCVSARCDPGSSPESRLPLFALPRLAIRMIVFIVLVVFCVFRSTVQLVDLVSVCECL